MPKQLLYICIGLLSMVVAVVQCSGSDRRWAKAFHDALQSRDSMIQSIRNLKRGVGVRRMQTLMKNLEELPAKIEGIDRLDVSTMERNRTLMGILLGYNTRPIGRKLFRSPNLENDYRQGLGAMIKAFQGYHNFRCIQALYSSSDVLQGFNFPIDYMCYRARDNLVQRHEYIFSTRRICYDAKRCSGRRRPYPFGDRRGGTNVQEACRTDDNSCDVEKALPMMGALLWYKVSTFIAKSLCRNYLGQPETSVLTSEHNDIKDMARLVMAYASTLSWDQFFEEAMRRRAYSCLGVALSLIEEYEKSFSSSPTACYELDAEDVCIYGDINKEYQSLRKLQQYRLRPGQTRNLRHFANINHGKMVELKRRALQHIDLLGNIRSVDENLAEATHGISTYFLRLAEYDQGIADQDVLFLAGKLTDFEAKAATLSEKVGLDVTNVLFAANTILGIQLWEEIVVMKAKIAEQMNPIATIFGGLELGEMYEQAAEIANAVQQITHGVALLTTLSNVYKDSYDLSVKFKENADQISNLQTMIDAIKENRVEEIGIDADKFVEAYGGYTPKVDRADLERNDALWGAYKDSACDLLYGAEGVAVGVAQTVVSGMVLCEKLEGTLAEFASLRENIFDFQFDLVDSFALVVRGNIAKKLSQSIEVSNEVLKSSQLMLGYFMTQYRLQSAASLYCDKLEYKNQGRRVKVCSTETGLFTPNDLDGLIAYKPDTTYHLDERFVYLPTRSQFQGDKGFVNLQSLAEGNLVTFRPPANRTWLRQFNWVASDETIAPFVQSFKLYLPHKTYRTGRDQRFSKTRVQLSSIGGSAVSSDTKVVYNLPLQHSHYITVYNEGFNPSRCPSGKEITNPYSLCNNLPNMCDTMTRTPGTSMMPTILSTWQLSYVMESSTEVIEWDAPDPTTDLRLIAKVKLRFPADQSSKRGSFQLRDSSIHGCCTGNMYRPKWNEDTCISCPVKPEVGTDSVSHLGGYFCEKGVV